MADFNADDFRATPPVPTNIRDTMTLLTDDEISLAHQVSDHLKRKCSGYQSRVLFENVNDFDFIAVCCEIHFANWVGQEYEFNFGQTHGDGGIDRMVHGRTCQVKGIDATKYSNLAYVVNHLNLLVKETQAQAEFYNVVLFAAPGYCKISNWTTREYVLQHSPRTWPQHISNHVIPLRHLDPPDTFGPVIRGEI